MLVWLGSFPEAVRIKGHLIHLRARDARTDDNAEGFVLAMLKFSVESRYDHLMQLSAQEMDQYSFWRRQCPTKDSVEGHLLVCKAAQVVPLTCPVPVQQFTDARPHGLIIQMEEGQPERLFSEHRRVLQDLCQQEVNVPAVLLRLPPKFAELIVAGQCDRFILPDFNSLVTTTKYTWYCNWRRLGLSEASLPPMRFQFLQQHVEQDSQRKFGDVDIHLLKSIASHVRGFASNLIGEGGIQHQEQAAAVHKDLCRFQGLIDELDPVAVQSTIHNVTAGEGPAQQKTIPYRAAFVIQVLLQCDLLRTDASLKDSVKQALALIIPKSLLPMFLDMVEEYISPSPGQISRWRLLLDAAFMLWTRNDRRKAWSEDRSFARWLMVDSSPQGGRDYELLVMSYASVSDLPILVSLADVMNNMCVDRPSELDDEFISSQEQLQRQIQELLVMERPPPVVLGSGRTSLPDKFAATMHALFLETGSSKDLRTLTSEVVSSTSDLGTEFNIVRVRGARPSDLLPWIVEEVLEREDDWPVEEKLIHFSNALAIPGILHVLHNAAKRMLTGLPELNTAVDLLQVVAELVRKKHTQERLCQRCFNSEVGVQLQPLIMGFKGKVHAARWGTVAFATQEMLRLERPLRWGWNLALFLGNNTDQASEQAVKATSADGAITSEFWWSCLRVLDKLHCAIRHLFAWSEGCACHGYPVVSQDPDAAELDADSKAWNRLCEKCPLRGRRAPEIACGDFLAELRRQLDTSAADLLLNLPNTLSPEQRGLLLGEFEKGRASLLFNIALKVNAMNVPPLLVFGVAHFNLQKAHDALRVCMDSDNTDGLMGELKSAHVLAEAHAWLDGESLSELPHMSAFVGKLRFAFSVERTIEGEHAAIHHFIRKAPHHTVAYVSLARRLPHIKAKLAAPSFFEDLSAMLESVRNPKLVVCQLGLGQHSACANVSHPWDSIFGKIVYRSDPVTTQASSVPVEVRPLPPGGPDRVQLQIAAGSSDNVALAGDYYAQQLHQAALEHFRVRLQEVCSEAEGRDVTFSIFGCEAVLSSMFELPAARPAALMQEQGPAHPALALTDGAHVEVAAHDSCPVLEANVVAAGNELSVAQKIFDEAFVQLRKPKDPNAPKAFAFKVVSVNPSQSKVPLQNVVESSDIAVSLLRTLRLDVSRRAWIVDSTPLKLRSPVGGQSEASSNTALSEPSVPIVFSPSSISFDSLMKVSVWDVLPDTGLHLSSCAASLSGKEIPHHVAEMSQLLLNIYEAGAAGFCPSNPSQAERTCLDFLRESDLVKPTPENQTCWVFTPNARDHLIVTRTLVHAKPLMTSRTVPYVEMDLYELYRALENQGFKCCVCSRSEKKQIKALSYIPGESEKVWYMEAGKPPSKHYLVSLLHAETHRAPVPALADAATSLNILVTHGIVEKKPEPKSKASARKRMAGLDCQITEGDWDIPEPLPKRARKQPKRIADSDVMLPAIEDVEGPLAAVGPPSPVASVSSNATERYSAPDETDEAQGVAQAAAADEGVELPASHEAETPLPCPEQPAPEHGASGSDSDSSSTSSSKPEQPKSDSSSSSSSSSNSSGDSGAAAATRKKPQFQRKKDMTRSTAGQQFRLTPRYAQDNETIIGYQMTCLCRLHANCNKSLANSVSGSDELSVRMLKAWIAWGQDTPNKQAHKGVWSRVLSANKNGQLPSMSQLDASLDVPETVPGNPAQPVPKRRQRHGAKAKSKPRPSPSTASPPTPPDVTSRMEALIQSGALPRVSKQQRKRNRLTGGTSYGVPPDLREALHWGFVHPNLPAPRGMRWVASGLKEFTLQYQGG